MSIRDDIFLAVNEHGQSWADRIAGIPHYRTAILPSEMLAFCCLAEWYGCRLIIESGRDFGYSTDALTAPHPHPWVVFSIEPEPRQDSDARFSGRRVVLIKSACQAVLPVLAPQCPWAFLIDGPKQEAALTVAEQHGGPAAFCAIHDANRGAPVRAILERRGGVWFSDDPEYLAAWGHVDAEALGLRGRTHAVEYQTGSCLALLRHEQ